MKTVVFLLEELSAKIFLEGLIKANFLFEEEDLSLRYLVFEGKQDLEKNIVRRLKDWRLTDTYFIIMRDQDSGDCFAIKEALQEKCKSAGKESVSIVRIACRELESFYLGDLVAVGKSLGLPTLAKNQSKASYRNPDALESPSKVLEQLTKNKYQKIDGSRKIAPNMTPNKNKSHSFLVLYSSLSRIIQEEAHEQ
jgi:hypothetical protein